jgi:hypothetical protein
MELLIRTVDKGPDAMHSKRGHVIWVCPDGWEWSEAERTNPEWMIISVPITQIEADGLLSLPHDGDPPGRRRFRLNLNGLAHGNTISRAALMARVI